MRYVVEADPGGDEGLLRGPRELRNVPECRDRDRAPDAARSEGRGDPMSHAEHVHPGGDVAVLEVPPHRDLHALALLLVLPPQ